MLRRVAAPLLLFLLISTALPGLVRAQSTALPPLDYPLREVLELRITPLPPGGLLPVRHGNWWGFADTTGRWIITPSLVAGVLFPPAGLLQVQGLLAEDREEAETLRDRYQSRGTPLDDYWEDTPRPRAFLNAAGELLRVTAAEAAVLLPDGRLRAVPRREVRAGQVELLTVSDLGLVENPYARGQARSFVTRPLLAGRAEARRVPGDTHPPPGLRRLQGEAARLHTTERTSFETLGRGRYTIRRSTRQFAERVKYRHSRREEQGWEDEEGPVMLLNRRGRPLTAAAYQDISDFRGRLAVLYRYAPDGYRRMTDTVGYLGLLTRRGRVLLPPTNAGVQLWPHHRALVTRQHRITTYNSDPGIVRRGIVNRHGRWLLPPQPSLSLPDAAGYLRRRCGRAAGDTVVEFLTGRGRPAFPKLPALRQASAFAHGRAWVRTDAGPGLLSTAGRWVVRPGQYEQLLFMGDYYTKEFHERDHQNVRFEPTRFVRDNLHVPHPPGYQEEEHYSDTAYAVVRQQGRYGLLRLATGQLLVPCRYDEITYWDGRYGSARREGHDYVLRARDGHELLPGRYRGESYSFAGQPPRLHIYPDPDHWLVADTSGHPLTPALRRAPGGRSFLTPEGLAEVQVADHAGQPCYAWVVAATGLPAFAADDCPAITYSGQTPWFHTRYTSYGAHDKGVVPSGAYVRWLPHGERRLLHVRNGQLVDLTGHSYYDLEQLAGGWHFALNDDSQELLISPTGQEYVAPKGHHWNRHFHLPGNVVPFANGTAAAVEGLRSELVLIGPEGGLVTRGGRALEGARGRKRRQN
ncbi:hypothetical protein Q5H93_20630 [Hymenobacter sp. ASUV-10]|uniref:WG repeat-containing protein n=1 Tax=Hymenobacter aranciens TaxID=3063996 RepID=A0ABT9BHH9_9BACT|nr:hypothetical protein [Hymenobacter sp. ASUV-10]MDO7877164.1 hypothetical protein [Hymenobacter sp. ASUV-10]